MESRRLLSATLPSNLQITSDPSVQQSPSVAVDPHAPQHVVVAYMDYSLVNSGYAGIGISSSGDGGSSWTRSSIPLPVGFDQSATEPIAKFDDQGHVFVMFMAGKFLGEKPPINDPLGLNANGVRWRTDGFTSNNGIFISRSDDDGETWQVPAAASATRYEGAPVPYDIMPDMAIDTSPSSPHYGSIYVVWSRFYPAGQYPGEQQISTGGSRMQIAVSVDDGMSYQPRPSINDMENTGIGMVPGQGYPTTPRIAVGPQGYVYVAYYDFGNFIVMHSEDAAESFDAVSQEGAQNGMHALFGSDGTAADPVAGGALMGLHGFRTTDTRAIVADPTRPGTIYASDGIATFDGAGNEIDSDVRFARSPDNSTSWQPLQVGGRDAPINDDNNYQPVSQAPSDVSGRQFLVRLAINNAGDVVAVWYDTRRDPSYQKLDVFGAISTDGGLSFGPNFHITQQNFDVRNGKFTDARGDPNYFLGDFLGLSTVGDMAYVAWTDTRTGNQDIFFSTFSISNPPPPDNDRFEPNNSATSATDLGPVLQQHIPKLRIAPDDSDYFRFEPVASGILDIKAISSAAGSSLKIDLLTGDGARILASGSEILDANGQVTAESIQYSGISNQAYLLRISPVDGVNCDYSLDLQAFTANWGIVTSGNLRASVNIDDQLYYLVTPAASGSFFVNLAPDRNFSGALSIEILDGQTLATLGAGSTSATADVAQGQQLLIHVAAADGSTASGGFELDAVNLDVFATADRAALLFPAGAGPSQIASGDVNNDGFDDLVVTNALSNTVSILLSNGDSTFQSPRQFPVGVYRPGTTGGLLQLFRRDLVLADFNRDGNLDIAVTNLNSSDVSILLGRGDGTFQPQRRFDATDAPFGIAAGDFNNDGISDLAVISEASVGIQVAVLLGHGDGTFGLETLLLTGINDPGVVDSTVKIADMNGDGKQDLVYTAGQGTYLRLGGGDGFTFGPPSRVGGSGPGLAVADLNQDGKPDIATAGYFTNRVSVDLGSGSGEFSTAVNFNSGQTPAVIQAADVASLNSDGSLGPADGIPDLIWIDTGAPTVAVQGPPEVLIACGSQDAEGKLSYSDPISLASSLHQPLGLALGDFTGDQTPAGDRINEIAFVDTDGIRLIFNQQLSLASNGTFDTARELGTVVHLLEPTLTIVPGREDAWYQFNAPTEATTGAHEVVDVSGDFSATRGAGLSMEVVDAAGIVLASGEHLRVRAAQGQKLYIHIFGRTDTSGARGVGAYTLDIDVLPQLVSMEGQPIAPGINGGAGGPISSLVLTFQGDRLDQTAAQDSANYRVTWLGPDDIAGTSDDRAIPIHAADAQAVVYDPSANVDIVSGDRYPTAVRQTVTLLFDKPLRAGSYRVTISPDVVAAAFNYLESAAHPLVSVEPSGIRAGADVVVKNAVGATSGQIDFTAFKAGTAFLSQLQGDLSALLDQNLTAGEAEQVTAVLLAQLRTRLSSAARTTSILAIFLDPLALDLQDPAGQHVSYDLGSGSFANAIPNAFVSVASNIEVIVIPLVAGNFTLQVSDVPATARGGAVVLGDQPQALSWTAPLEAGQKTFLIATGADPGPLRLATPQQSALSSAIGGALVYTDVNAAAPAPASPPAQTSSLSSVPAGRVHLAFVVPPLGRTHLPLNLQQLLDAAAALVKRMIAWRFGFLIGAEAAVPQPPQEPQNRETPPADESSQAPPGVDGVDDQRSNRDEEDADANENRANASIEIRPPPASERQTHRIAFAAMMTLMTPHKRIGRRRKKRGRGIGRREKTNE